MPQTWRRLGTLTRPTAWGSAPVGSLAAGATKSITVTLNRAMPSANYGVIPILTGTTTLLASVEIVGVTARTTTTVTITVRAPGVLASGATLEVTAIG